MLVSGVQQTDSVTLYFFFRFFSLIRLLRNIEYSSLCYTVGPCWLSILQSNLLITKLQRPFKSAVDSADSSLDSAEVVYPAGAAEAHVPVLSIN